MLDGADVAPAVAPRAGAPTISLARQPIFDRAQRLYGYELLQRLAAGETWDVDDDVVTLQVIRKALFDFGLPGLAGRGRLFLNVGPRCLADQEYLVFPPERTVLEVLERVECDDALLADVQVARSMGYAVALDDYVGEARFDRLLPLVDIVKLDVLDCDDAQLHDVLARLRRLAPKATLLAEKVESEAQFQELMARPVDLFQGFFFKKPVTLTTTSTVPSNQAALLKVTAALQSSEVEFDHLAALISGVPKLAFQLLRLTNSASVGLPRSVATVHAAMIALGLGQLRKLVHILLVTSRTSGTPEVGTLGLVRARLCALLAEAGGGDEEAAFTVGLFSLMDVVLGQPLADIVTEVRLRPDVEDALLRDVGVLAGYLRSAKLAEETNGEQPPVAAGLLFQAVAWAEDLVSELSR